MYPHTQAIETLHDKDIYVKCELGKKLHS